MKTILCPTDFSAIASNAVYYADELAQRTSTRMVLSHSIYAPAALELVSYGAAPCALHDQDARYEETQRKKLEDIRFTLDKANWGMPVIYETKLRYGLTNDTLPHLAREEHADFVVIGHEGAAGLKKVLAAAADIIKGSPCPVLIIPSKARFKLLRNMVFVTDLKGKPSDDVHLALKLASLFEAKIHFLQVLPDPGTENQAFTREEINRMYKRLPYKNVTFHKKIIPHIEDGISRFCHRHQADMLVMGHQPKAFWKYFFCQEYNRETAWLSNLPLLVNPYYF